jgi:hypothetical protein
MASYQIISWRDIPAQVTVTGDSGQVSGMLSGRFQKAIDAAAMAAGAADQDAYLAGWRRSEPQERPGRASEVLAVVMAELEASHPAKILHELVRLGGKATLNFLE